jgi:hypothetical protein
MTVGDNYTDAEMADAHFTHDLANGNMRDARFLYQERFLATGS